MSTLLSVAMAALLAANPPPDVPPRFAMTGALVAAPAQSPDARFSLAASARLRADAPTAERFQLKSANGSLACDNAGNVLFQNSFE